MNMVQEKEKRFTAEVEDQQLDEQRVERGFDPMMKMF
jgi:hypothetical protein